MVTAKMRLVAFLWVVVVVIASIFITSCGGGGGGSTTPPPPPSNPAPQISGLSPASITAGSAAMTLTINGTGFLSSSTVQWGSTTHSSTFVSASQITVPLSETDIAIGASIIVKVTNPSPGGGSASATFAINNPQPMVSSVAPSSVNAGQAETSVTVSGTGFVSASIVNVNGSSRPTTFVSTTQLQAKLPASDFVASGHLEITVSNAAPGGGTSSATPASTITVNNFAPVLESISPASVSAGAPATITLTGKSFAANSVAQINGVARPTTYGSETQLRLSAPASDLASLGTLQISVLNPAPGGGTSMALPLSVVYPVPTVSLLNPAAVSAGASGLTLRVQGTGFFPASTVLWNGTAKPTQFIDSTALSATISASDVSAVGTAQVTVSNPAPGGGTSTAATFSIT